MTTDQIPWKRVQNVTISIGYGLQHGELAERLIAPVLKTGERASVPEVQILYSPPETRD